VDAPGGTPSGPLDRSIEEKIYVPEKNYWDVHGTKWHRNVRPNVKSHGNRSRGRLALHTTSWAPPGGQEGECSSNTWSIDFYTTKGVAPWWSVERMHVLRDFYTEIAREPAWRARILSYPTLSSPQRGCFDLWITSCGWTHSGFWWLLILLLWSLNEVLRRQGRRVERPSWSRSACSCTVKREPISAWCACRLDVTVLSSAPVVIGDAPGGEIFKFSCARVTCGRGYIWDVKFRD